jgi:hypothetical protein
MLILYSSLTFHCSFTLHVTWKTTVPGSFSTDYNMVKKKDTMCKSTHLHVKTSSVVMCILHVTLQVYMPSHCLVRLYVFHYYSIILM